MKPFKECRYSAFISYAHASNMAHDNWVTRFKDALEPILRIRLGRVLRLEVPEMHMSGQGGNGPVAGLLARQLQESIADSFFMIVVVEESYLDSGWCIKELEYFRSLFGEQGFAERLFVVVMSEPAMKDLATRSDWQRLVPSDLVWMPFFNPKQRDLPVRVSLSETLGLTAEFQEVLEAVIGRMVEVARKPAPPQARPAGTASRLVDSTRSMLMGVPAPELAEATARFASQLRQRGVAVRELGPDSLQGEFAEFDDAGTLLLPFGSGGQHLAPFKFIPGGHLAAQRGAWLDKQRPPEGLVWLDLRAEPCTTPPAKGHAELLEEVAPQSVTPERLLARYQRRKSDAEGGAEPVLPRSRPVNIYIESNQNEVDLWEDLGERIKSRWQALIEQYEPATVPPLRLNPRGLPMQDFDDDLLVDADGVVLLWGNKDEASLRAQIRKVEDRLGGDPPPPGIVAYLMPQQPERPGPIEATYWKVLRFQDANTANIDIVAPETDRLEKFLRKILDRTAKRKPAADGALARRA